MLKDPAPSPPAADAIALSALAWILEDQERAARLLALTGWDAAMLRDSLSARPTQAAVLSFLSAHEPDLLACAEALGVPPGLIARAARELGA